MSLLTEAMEPCQIIDRTTVPDGYGGTMPQWVPGAEFNAAIVLDISTEARKAVAEGVKNLYTVTVQRNVNLRTGEVIQRLSDGRYLRVTSDGTDKKTPASAGLDMRQMSAEEIGGLPDG
jgi:head-tail adaptor